MTIHQMFGRNGHSDPKKTSDGENYHVQNYDIKAFKRRIAHIVMKSGCVFAFL